MRDVFLMMKEELESSYPETIKIPGKEGGYIRVPVSVNAEWYRIFCERHKTRSRRFPKPRTVIKRVDTLRALDRLAQGNTEGVYAERLLSVIEEFYQSREFNREVQDRQELQDCCGAF